MSRRPSTWLSAGRVIRRFRFPLLLLVVGLALNIVVYTGNLRTSERRAAEELSADAGALSSLIKEAVQHGLTQISAVDGLFQASEEVTAAEFEDFAHIIGGEPVSLLGFAWMVPAEGVDAYLAETRNTWPDFEIFEETAGRRTAVSARNRYIPIHYAVSFSDLPEERGFDLASDPHRLAAIDRTLETNEPALTGFVDIEAGTAVGDIELFLAVAGLPGKPTGVTFTVLEIDEVLADRAPEILPPGGSWSLTQIASGTSDTFGLVSRSDLWRGTIDVFDSVFLLDVRASEDVLGQERAGRLTAFMLGLVAAVLAALALHFFIQQLRSREEVERLRDITKQKDRFLAGVSHELRTPITAVLGLLEVLADNRHALAENETSEYIELARQEAKELADLVEDLLTAGRLSAGTLTVAAAPVDLSIQVRRVIDRLALPLGMHFEIGEPLGSVWADPLRLRQILRNLATNALRYGERLVEIKAAISERAVSIEVRNDGPPIPVPMRERIFEPFQTAGSTPTQPDSIGLGLSISRQLARAMGGDLTYRYAEGKSVFTLTLPTSRLALTERIPRPAEPSLR